MSYTNVYTKVPKSKINLINDTQDLLVYTTTTGGIQPPVIEKSYNNFYEFILTSGEKKTLVIDTILDESHINEITGNNKSLLQKVYISNNCTSIESNCFKDCTNLSYSSYTNTTDASLTTINSSAFENCTNLDECRLFNINNNITTIGNNAFKNCNKLYEVKLDNTQIQSLGTNAFENNSYLVTVHFPSSLTYIGSECFKNSGIINIYFDSNLPASLGTDIFNSISENACCYYNSSFISGGSYTSLKNLFPTNGSDVIFINTTNNSIENEETFYSITNTNVASSIVNTTNAILNSIIIKRNGNTFYTIDLDYDNTLSGTTTLGYASWSSGIIRLNPDNDTGSNINFNNVSTSLNVVVLVHEILHILGFGSGTEWTSFKNSDAISDDHFVGKNAVYQYNRLLQFNGYNKKLKHLTIEDSGGSGTAGAHTEEGFRVITDSNGSNTWVPQIRYDENANIFPSFYQEIMTGWIDSSTYFTWQCCGVLQDLGFSINYNSGYVYSGSISYLPSLSLAQTNVINNIDNSNNSTSNNSTSNNSTSNNINTIFRCSCHNNNFIIAKI